MVLLVGARLDRSAPCWRSKRRHRHARRERHDGRRAAPAGQVPDAGRSATGSRSSCSSACRRCPACRRRRLATAAIRSADSSRASSWRVSPRTPQRTLAVNLMAPKHLETFGVPLVQGRAFEPQEVARGDRVALINEAAAKLWPAGRNPIGSRLSLGLLAQTTGPFGAEITAAVARRHRGRHRAQHAEQRAAKRAERRWR